MSSSRGNSVSTLQVKLLRDQITTRDQEIARLGSLLEMERGQNTGYHRREGGGSDEEGTTSHYVKMSRVEQLEMQVDYLNESISELEKVFRSLKVLQSVITKKKNIATLEKEKSYHRNEGEKRIRELTAELEDCQRKNKHLCADLEKLESMMEDLDNLRKKPMDTKKDQHARRGPVPSKVPVSTKKTPAANAPNAQTLEGNHRDTIRMTDQLFTESRAFVQQIQELKIKNTNLQTDLNTAREELLESSRRMQLSEKQLGEIRKSHPYIQVELNDRVRTSSPTRESRDETVQSITAENQVLRTRVVDLEKRSWDFEKQNEELKQKAQTLVQLEAELLKSRTLASSLQSQLQEMETEILRLTRDMESNDQMKDETLRQKRDLLSELANIRQERDAMVHSLKDFESKLKSINGEIEVISSDRDRLRQLYEQVNKEVQSLRQQESSWKSNVTDAKTSKESEIERLKTELNLARLENRLRSQPSKKATVMDSSQALDGDRDVDAPEFPTQQQSLEELDVMSDRISMLDKQNEQLKMELAERKSTIEQLSNALREAQTEQEDMKTTLTSLQKTSAEKEKHLITAKSELDRMATMQESQTMTVAEQRELIARLDEERDQWRHDIDAKTELTAELEEYIQKLKDRTSIMEKEMHVMQDEMTLLQSHLQDQDREISSLQRQLDETALEKQHLVEENHRLAAELENVNADLEAMVKENQVLNKELSDTVLHRDSLKDEIDAQKRHGSYLEEILETKESEKEQIMSSYRKLINEHTELEGEIRRANEVESGLKMELVMKEKQMLHLQRTQEEQEASHQQMRMDLEAYETQCGSMFFDLRDRKDDIIFVSHDSLTHSLTHLVDLTRSLSTLERDLQSLHIEKKQMAREMDTMRDLLMQAQRTKDELHRQLAMQTSDAERLRENITRQENEREAMMSELRTEVFFWRFLFSYPHPLSSL